MKKNKLLLNSILFLLISFTFFWFLDDLFYIILFIFPIPVYALIIWFNFILIKSIINIITKKEYINFITILILIITIIINFNFPFREVKVNLEFKLYKNKREKIIEYIKKEKVFENESGKVSLPLYLKNIYSSGEIYVYQNDNNGMVIGFYIVKGIVSSESIQLIYSSDNENLIINNDKLYRIVKIKKLDNNWYYVEID